jgi:hypothetical protein
MKPTTDWTQGQQEGTGAKSKFRLPNGLTPRQARFVQEYCRDHNATQAAKRAKYSEKTAYSIGSELLHTPKVAAAIAKLTEERARRREAYAVEHGKPPARGVRSEAREAAAGCTVAIKAQRAALQAQLLPESITFYCTLVREGRGVEARTYARSQFRMFALALLANHGLTTPTGKRLSADAVERALAGIAAGRASC